MPSAEAASAEVRVSGALEPDAAAAVLSLVERAAAADGVSPLSEHVVLHLRYGGDPEARNLLVWSGGELAGYGHLDLADPDEGPSAEIVVDPPARRHGIGLRLLTVVLAEAGDAGLRVWAHGDLPSAAALAATAGLHRARALWQMRRSLPAGIDAPELADGISVRTFRSGHDEDAWIALNHRAFAEHPEQGAWTRDDLDMREREPWFDPDGFFLAERGGELVGFHWTKIHEASGEEDPGGQEDEAIGEVYVVGVDSSARGTGLGRALTVIGVRYLQDRGLGQVMLYVDETNTAAIALYESLGFTRWHTDVMFAAEPSAS